MKEPRKCPQCKQWKELNEDNFHRDRSRKTGFAVWCKRCAHIYQLKKRAEGFHLESEHLIDDPTFSKFDRDCVTAQRTRPTGCELSIYQEAL
jgi:hypothetical protein